MRKKIQNILSNPQVIEMLAIACFAIGLIIRLHWLAADGYDFDVWTNKNWGISVVKFGFIESYSTQVNNTILPNYPPISVIVFALTNYVASVLDAVTNIDLGVLQTITIKLPANIADIGISVVLYLFSSMYTSKERSFLIAGLYFLHPASMYNSAYWGQTDSIFTLCSLLTVYFLCKNRFKLAGTIAAIGILCKMQAIIFFPLFGLYAILQKKQPIKKLCESLIAFIATVALIALPFIVAGKGDLLLNVYIGSVGYYPTTSMFAYNIWWLLYGDNQISDETLLLHIISLKNIGLILFSLTYLSSVVFFGKKQWSNCDTKQKNAVFLMCMAIVSGGFFLCNTQMHERYLYPFIVFLLPLLATKKQFILPYILISLCHFWNLVGVLPYSKFDKMLFAKFAALDVVIAGVTVCSFIWILFEAYRCVWPKKIHIKSTEEYMMPNQLFAIQSN